MKLAKQVCGVPFVNFMRIINNCIDLFWEFNMRFTNVNNFRLLK